MAEPSNQINYDQATRRDQGDKGIDMQPTFKARVQQFWKWYSDNAARFYETIEDGKCPSLADEVSEAASRFIPGLSWVFGPGLDGGHSFTVTGEGERTRQLLARYWIQHAVPLPGWTFYASRQATDAEDLANAAIQVGENETVDSQNFMIRTEVDDEKKLLHVTAWHPSLTVVPKEHHLQIFFLLLDEALGEFGTEQWIGQIKLEPFQEDDKTRSLAELPQFVTHVNEYHKWDKATPLDTYTAYQTEQNDPDAKLTGPRTDTMAGTSMIPELVFEFIEHGKLGNNPFADTGASMLYLALDNTIFADPSQAAEVRANIEDALEHALVAELSGEVLGGAYGTKQSYIDLLVFDGELSQVIVDKKMDELNLAGRYSVHALG